MEMYIKQKRRLKKTPFLLYSPHFFFGFFQVLFEDIDSGKNGFFESGTIPFRDQFASG